VKKQIVAAEEEGDIQVNKEFLMEDILDMGYQKKNQNGLNSEAKFENKTLWNYADSFKIDR